MKKCFFCGADCPQAGRDVVAILCGGCVSKLVPQPEYRPVALKPTYEERMAKKEERKAKKVARLEALKNAKRGRARGWHFKKLFAYEDKFYSFGKEIDAALAAKLKKEIAKEESEVVIPKKRGRKPKTESVTAAAPKKRGRKPKTEIVTVAPKKRGRPKKIVR